MVLKSKKIWHDVIWSDPDLTYEKSERTVENRSDVREVKEECFR